MKAAQAVIPLMRASTAPSTAAGRVSLIRGVEVFNCLPGEAAPRGCLQALEELEGLAGLSPTSAVSLLVAARGAEALGARLFSRGWRPRGDALPLLGSEWSCEYYIDTGSRSARSVSGVAEGFVIKTSILARCASEGGLRERVLYPLPRGKPSFLVAEGGDRLRQAATYIVEVASALALASGEARLPGGLDGWPRLVVRHGSLLQQVGVYTNEVFSMDRDFAEALLRYSGLGEATARELVAEATLEVPGGPPRVNAGVLAAAILRRLRGAVGGDASVAGVAEDTSRGRHLTLQALLAVIERSGDELFREPVELGVEELEEEPGCLGDLDPEAAVAGLLNAVDRYAAHLRNAIYGGLLDREPQSRREARALYSELAQRLSQDPGGLVRRAYERQVLTRYFSLASDTHFILAYNYLFAGTEGLAATERMSKSMLVAPLLEANVESKGIHEMGGPSPGEAARWVEGVEYRYVNPEPPPPCRRLARESRRLGLDRRILAELVSVKPPLRLEYYASDARRDLVDTKVALAAAATQYGVPSQLLVVDSRSRIDEWDLGALRQLLEEKARRAMPYSTFIRDFATRLQYVA